MTWYEVVGAAVIILGVLLVYVGLVGVFQYRVFSLKVLSAAKIDTMGIVAVLLGAAIYRGVSWFSVKSLFILFIVLFASPIVSAQILSRAREDGES